MNLRNSQLLRAINASKQRSPTNNLPRLELCRGSLSCGDYAMKISFCSNKELNNAVYLPKF
jgi:hypothetical protein